MLSPFDPHLVSLTEAAKRLPSLRKGRPVHTSTLWRWSKRGIRGSYLQTVRVGNRTFTTPAALSEFFEHVSLAGVPRPKSGRQSNSSDYEERIEQELRSRFRL